MTIYTPYNETITGASLTGSTGTADRTYTLTNDDAVAGMFSVMVAGARWQQGTHFTINTTTNTVTFLQPVWDDQAITLDYLTEDTTSTATGSDYTSTLEISRAGGIGREIFGENLGTGDGSEDSYDLANGNVIASSYTLKYGASGDNSLSTLIETSDYSIDKDMGTIVLTSSGKTKCNGKIIYANYMYNPKLSDTIIDSFVSKASKEVEELTGNYWGSATSETEYFDGYDFGYPQTDRPFGNDLDDYDYPEFELRYRGITGVTPINFLDFEGNTDQTLASDEYQYTSEGRIIINKTIPNGKRNIEITYTHGYSSLPVLVQELASYIGAKMVLVYLSGGSYDDVTNYTVGRKTFMIGEQYVNIREVIAQVNARIDTILDSLGFRYACA